MGGWVQGQISLNLFLRLIAVSAGALPDARNDVLGGISEWRKTTSMKRFLTASVAQIWGVCLLDILSRRWMGNITEAQLLVFADYKGS